jgi:hypothetical protein
MSDYPLKHFSLKNDTDKDYGSLDVLDAKQKVSNLYPECFNIDTDGQNDVDTYFTDSDKILIIIDDDVLCLSRETMVERVNENYDYKREIYGEIYIKFLGHSWTTEDEFCELLNEEKSVFHFTLNGARNVEGIVYVKLIQSWDLEYIANSYNHGEYDEEEEDLPSLELNMGPSSIIFDNSRNISEEDQQLLDEYFRENPDEVHPDLNILLGELREAKEYQNNQWGAGNMGDDEDEVVFDEEEDKNEEDEDDEEDEEY